MLQISILLIYIKLLQRHSLVRVAALGAVPRRRNRDKVEWACYSRCNAINFTRVHSMVCACIYFVEMTLLFMVCELQLFVLDISPFKTSLTQLFRLKVLKSEIERGVFASV